MSLSHLERLRSACDLLAVKGYETEQTRLTCYSAARFDSELADRAAGDPLIRLSAWRGSTPEGRVRYPRRLGSPRRLAACRFPRWHGVKGRHTATFV
jgi:hypothetical protein